MLAREQFIFCFFFSRRRQHTRYDKINNGLVVVVGSTKIEKEIVFHHTQKTSQRWFIKPIELFELFDPFLIKASWWLALPLLALVLALLFSDT